MIVIDEDLNLFAKTERERLDWESKKLHPRARKITTVLAQYLYLAGYPCVITSINADRDESPIHQAWRAVDVRANVMKPEEAEEIRQKINKRFVYGLTGRGKPSHTIVPLDHGTAPHFHVQVKE